MAGGSGGRSCTRPFISPSELYYLALCTHSRPMMREHNIIFLRALLSSSLHALQAYDEGAYERLYAGTSPGFFGRFWGCSKLAEFCRLQNEDEITLI